MKAVAKVSNAMSIIFVVILIFWLVKLNYNDLSFKQNRSAYLGISSVLLMIFALQMIKRSVNRKRK